MTDHFVRIVDGAPVTPWYLSARGGVQAIAQSLFPNTGFPADCTEADLSDYGFFPIRTVARPNYDPDTEKVVEIAPIFYGNEWLQTYEVQPLTQEELDAIVAFQLAQDMALTCTPRQGRLAMLQLGILDAVDAAVAASSRSVQITWEFAVLLERSDPTWDAMGAVMDPVITPEQITLMFRLAQTK